MAINFTKSTMCNRAKSEVCTRYSPLGPIGPIGPISPGYPGRPISPFIPGTPGYPSTPSTPGTPSRPNIKRKEEKVSCKTCYMHPYSNKLGFLDAHPIFMDLHSHALIMPLLFITAGRTRPAVP